MLAVVALSLALQVSVRIGPSSREDSLRQKRRDSLAVVIEESIRSSSSNRRRRPVSRDSVTPELERTAFRDEGARTLLYQARIARLSQDSALVSYQAKAYQRVSVGLGFRAIGRNRLLFRNEVASEVSWSRSGGALVNIKGHRAVAPAFGGDSDDADLDIMTPVPYYPGR